MRWLEELTGDGWYLLAEVYHGPAAAYRVVTVMGTASHTPVSASRVTGIDRPFSLRRENEREKAMWKG